MVSITLSSCATQPRSKTSEVVEIRITPPPEKVEKTHGQRPEIQVAREKSPDQLTSLHDVQVIEHKYFVIYYDKEFRLARWVKYELTKEQVASHEAKRRNRFMADPMLNGQSDIAVVPKEYRKTGYDQGHLAPSADFAFSQKANDDTFVMSNMVPQKPKLNRVAWRMLEDQVRKWACGEEKITVITGPILEAKMDHLPSGLPVPRDFFKVVFDETPPRKAIAFIYHQDDSTNVMKDRIVPLEYLDKRIGENFHSYLEAEERKPAQSIEWKECGS